MFFKVETSDQKKRGETPFDANRILRRSGWRGPVFRKPLRRDHGTDQAGREPIDEPKRVEIPEEPWVIKEAGRAAEDKPKVNRK